MRIYAGNLSYDVTEEDLRNEFAAFGKVNSVDVIIDKPSGRSKGFAFIEMPSIAEGQAAIAGLNEKLIKDRKIAVSAAKERTGERRSYGEKRDSGFGGGRRRRF